MISFLISVNISDEPNTVKTPCITVSNIELPDWAAPHNKIKMAPKIILKFNKNIISLFINHSKHKQRHID